MTPIPELLEQLKAEADPPVDRFFARIQQQMETIGARSFFSIWKSAVEGAEYLALADHEKQTLINLGRTLGRYDVEEQRIALNHAIQEMDMHRRCAAEERRSQGKVHAVLGLVAGVFMVIILL